MFKKIAGLFLAAAVMCSSAAITASAAEAEDDAAVAAADQSGEVSADGSSEVSADASSEVEAMLRQYSVTFGRLTVQAIGRLGSQRKKNVSTILQQVSLHMIFQ